MHLSTRLSRVSALWALAGLLAACSSEKIAPIAPLARGTAKSPDALPEMPISVVDAPITYALDPALDALERAVPKRFGDIEKRLSVPSNARQQLAFEATRTPFQVTFNGSRLTISTIVSYMGKGWYKPIIGPTIGASCGTDSIQPRIRLVLESDVGFARDWNLRTTTRIKSVTPMTDTPRDECRVTAFSINVTDKVVRSIEPLLAGKMPEVDRKIASFDLRKRVEKWYNLLNKGIRVHDSLWLMLAPQDVKLGAIALSDTAIVANVRLYARPFMVSGPKPPSDITSLPKFSRAERSVGDSAHLRLEGLLSYDDASATLNKAMAGKSFRRFNQSVTIDKARIYALGDGRVVLAIAMKGAVTGEAYLVGTPVLDTSTRTLTVPDLDFDVSTADDLVRGLAWLKKGDVVTELRKRAVLPLDGMLDDTRGKVEKALNRELTRGVELAGEVRTGRLVDVIATKRWLVVRAEATGKLGLHVDREIPAPKRRSAD